MKKLYMACILLIITLRVNPAKKDTWATIRRDIISNDRKDNIEGDFLPCLPGTGEVLLLETAILSFYEYTLLNSRRYTGARLK